MISARRPRNFCDLLARSFPPRLPRCLPDAVRRPRLELRVREHDERALGLLRAVDVATVEAATMAWCVTPFLRGR